MGLYVAATYSGLSLGPVLGGILTSAWGWRSVFISMALVSFVAVISGLVFLHGPEYEEEPAENSGKLRFDWGGTFCYIIAIFLLMYGFSNVGGSALAIVLMIIGLAGCVLFVRLEIGAANPIINVRVFMHNRNFLLSNLAAMFNYAATFAVGYLMSIYLQVIKGFSAWEAGLFLISQPVLQAVISPVAGKLSDKHSPFILASAGMAVCTVALVLFAFCGLRSPLAYIMADLLVIGVGFGLFSSPNQTAIMSCVGPGDYSIASSLIATSRNIGQVSSMALITLIMSLRLGQLSFAQAAKPALVGAFHLQFIIFAVICAVGVFISLQRKTKS
jgi:MFS family permease